jgi:hypothetical protein
MALSPVRTVAAYYEIGGLKHVQRENALRQSNPVVHKSVSVPDFPTEAPRILRAKGCQGGRTGGEAPLIQEGYGALAPGGGYGTLIPNP